MTIDFSGLPDPIETPVIYTEQEVKYFHGGPRGIKAVLPSIDTGAASCASYGGDGVCRRDRVYLTTIYEAAIIYAAMHPSGHGVVYEVEPIGDIEPDPDYMGRPGESVCCPSAKIIKRHRIPGKVLKKVRAACMEDAAF